MEPTRRSVAIRDVKFGENTTVVEPCNLYECAIGRECFIGPFVEIQRGVRIGDRTRVHSHSFICELVTIGHDCFISHGAMFVNDLFSTGHPAGGDQSKWRATNIGSFVSVGTGAVILPVDICDHVVIGAGSVVTRTIDTPGVYAGNPARKLRDL